MDIRDSLLIDAKVPGDEALGQWDVIIVPADYLMWITTGGPTQAPVAKWMGHLIDSCLKEDGKVIWV